jgi:hypothetical protein
MSKSAVLKILIPLLGAAVLAGAWRAGAALLQVKPVVLWTDALVYLLIAAVLAFFLYAHGREHLRAPWGRVLESRTAMICLVVLSAYLIVALLDSVHYRPALANSGASTQETYYSVEVLSLLDAIAQPLRSIPRRPIRRRSRPISTRARRWSGRTAAASGTIRACATAARICSIRKQIARRTSPPAHWSVPPWDWPCGSRPPRS